MSKFSLEKLKGERSKVLVMVYLDGQADGLYCLERAG